jgi:phosphoribosyl 1,2-cyclic phosphodiesterase
MKRIRFWGTRGSLPVALDAAAIRHKLAETLRAASGRRFVDDASIDRFLATLPFAVAGTYGGNSPCLEIDTGGPDYVLCDLGSGARAFGELAMALQPSGRTYHVFLSHVHWDHIIGLPFFAPAYVAGNRLVIYGGHRDLEAALRRQMDPPSFPVDFSHLRATIEFVHLQPGVRHAAAGMGVTVKQQRHAGDSFGYRFECGGRTVVYSTDSEHRTSHPGEAEGFVEFFRQADVVVFDAMYSFAEVMTVKADWGHSSNVSGVNLCHRAGARHLVLFHHEPGSSDAVLDQLLADTRALEQSTRSGTPLTVSAAYDGLVIEL